MKSIRVIRRLSYKATKGNRQFTFMNANTSRSYQHVSYSSYSPFTVLLYIFTVLVNRNTHPPEINNTNKEFEASVGVDVGVVYLKCDVTGLKILQ